MKLRELADIRLGLTVDPTLIKREKKIGSIYVQYLLASDFNEGKSQYLYQKDLKRIKDFSTKSFLFYGDYIFYKTAQDYRLFRYEGVSGQTVPGNGLIVIKPELGILKDFLSYEKNKNYFCRELKNKEEPNGEISIDLIGQIEIGTEDILELENANKAEQIGIRKPINLNNWPFRITQKPMPIDKLLKRISHNELLLDSEFQRRPGLWDIAIKSRLVESMIIRLPIPAFYFDGSDDDQWLVIDGLQRLSAINSFVNEEFELVELDYLPDLEGKSFSKLDRQQQRNIEEFEIFAYIIEKGTPKSVTYKIFKNINTSALKLEPQEIRHAINPGAPAELLKKIVDKQWFKDTLNLSDRQKDRMEDRETALRFIAFKRSRYSEYKPGIIDFLDAAMTDIYEIPATIQDVYISELENIFNFLTRTLSLKPFSRSIFDNSRSYGHNNILFELLTYGVSILPIEKRKQIIVNPNSFKEIILAHFSEKKDRFWETENSYTQENLKKRFEEIEGIFKKL